MENLIYKSSIFIHVIAGILSLVSGTIAMIAQKGRKVHNLAGQVFYWSMCVIFITTTIFFIIDPTNLRYQFFMGIGIISFYPNWSGKRMLKMKKVFEPTRLDKIMAFAVGISGIIMICYSVYGFMNPNQFRGLQYLFLIFGLGSIANGYGDLKVYLGFQKIEKMHWFLAHGGKMMGAYSAAWTAFCVNIVPRFLPNGTPFYAFILTWVLPGVLVGIIGNRILKFYKKKFGIEEKPSFWSRIFGKKAVQVA